jgi:hypothetical protein
MARITRIKKANLEHRCFNRRERTDRKAISGFLGEARKNAENGNLIFCTKDAKLTKEEGRKGNF